MSEYSEIRKLAEKLIVKAGKEIIRQRASASITIYKDRQDICTTADLAAEQIIITGIQAKFPDHQIQSEESGLIGSKANYKWIIDPLDGTKEFIRGIPQFNSSIAIEKNGTLIASAVYRPTDQSLYSASLGEGAFLNHQPIHVSSTTTLADSFIYCYLPSYKRNPQRYDVAWDKLGIFGRNVYRLRSLADENVGLCWLAQGGHEAYLNLSNTPKWHDVAPGLLIAQEAGAYIDNNLIKSLQVGSDISIIVTNNATIHKEIQNILEI